MGNILLTAFALMLIIEGVLPFLLPGLWRETFRRLTEMSDGQIRFIGLTSMLAGCCCCSSRGDETADPDSGFGKFQDRDSNRESPDQL
jgi:uncharacterized protein YjeT (DUF2065 family)